MDAVADLVIPVGDMALSTSVDAGAEKEPVTKRQAQLTAFFNLCSITLLYLFVLCENVFDIYFASTLLGEFEWPWRFDSISFNLVFVSLIFALVGLSMVVLDRSCCRYVLGDDDDIELSWCEKVKRFISGFFMLLCPCRVRTDTFGDVEEVVVFKASKRRWIVFAHRLADFSDVLLLLRLTTPEANGTCPEIGTFDYVNGALLMVSALMLSRDYVSCEGLDRTQGGLMAQAYASLLSVTVAVILSEATLFKMIAPGALLIIPLCVALGAKFMLLSVPIGAVVLAFIGTACNREKVFTALAVYSAMPILTLLLGQARLMSTSTHRRRIAGSVFGGDPDGWLRYVLDKKVFDDPVFMVAACRMNAEAFRYATKRLREDPTTILQAVRLNGEVLEYASENLRDDRQIVVMAVKQNAEAFEYASERLRDDRALVLSAVGKKGYMLKFVSERLKNDRDVVLTAVSKHGWALEYASQEMQDDREVVLAAMNKRHSMFSLRSASQRLRNDRNLVLQAVRAYGFNLQYASEDLRDDDEVVSVAVKRGVNIKFASERMQRKFSNNKKNKK